MGTHENEKNSPKSSEYSKSISKKEVYSGRGLLKKQDKAQINNLILHLKELEKEQSQKLVKGMK